MCIRDRHRQRCVDQQHQRRADLDDRWRRQLDQLSLIHISEPTRFLSISYAVFCLKKNNVMTTSHGVSPNVSAGEVWTSLIVFTLLYGVLAVIEMKLLLRFIAAGAPDFEEPVDPSEQDE